MFYNSIKIAKSQVYSNITSFKYQGTVNGIKIKTNIPFISSLDMPTIHVSGYMYGSKSSIDLNITFYVYHDSNMNPYFYVPTVSSSGGICPPIKLANENGLIVVYIDHKEHFPSLFVNAFSGLNRSSSYYQNWQIVD